MHTQATHDPLVPPHRPRTLTGLVKLFLAFVLFDFGTGGACAGAKLFDQGMGQWPMIGILLFLLSASLLIASAVLAVFAVRVTRTNYQLTKGIGEAIIVILALLQALASVAAVVGLFLLSIFFVYAISTRAGSNVSAKQHPATPLPTAQVDANPAATESLRATLERLAATTNKSLPADVDDHGTVKMIHVDVTGERTIQYTIQMTHIEIDVVDHSSFDVVNELFRAHVCRHETVRPQILDRGGMVALRFLNSHGRQIHFGGINLESCLSPPDGPGNPPETRSNQ